MRMHPTSLMKDHPRRKALIKFLDAVVPKAGRDGRIGLVIAEAWLLGYDTGLKRGRRARGKSHG